MDTDLMNLWLVAGMLSETETRDLITELQTARDGSKSDITELRKALGRAVEENDAVANTLDQFGALLDKLEDDN